MIADNITTFTYQQKDEYGDWLCTRFYPEGSPWDVVLKDYISFLSSVYGYDISEKVEIK